MKTSAHINVTYLIGAILVIGMLFMQFANDDAGNQSRALTDQSHNSASFLSDSPEDDSSFGHSGVQQIEAATPITDERALPRLVVCLQSAQLNVLSPPPWQA